MLDLPINSPFKLLKSYQKEDSRVFFGREKEIRQLYEVLMQSKFVMVYGASGTGKTSLIQCGLQGMYSPRDWLPILIRRKENFIESLWVELEEQYQARFAAFQQQQKELYPDEEVLSLEKFDSLRDLIKALFQLTYVPIYIIFDQFEEIFTLGDKAEQDAFFDSLRELNLFAEDLFCKIIIVTREEYIAHFYRYEKPFPFLFEYRFRVEKMREEQLLNVVNKSLRASYKGYPAFVVTSDAAPQILYNLTDQRGEIDLTTLQVYLDRLYKAAVKKNNEQNELIFDLDLIGSQKVENVLSDFLEEQVEQITQQLQQRFPDNKSIKEQPLLLQILFQLVTNQGTKQHRSAQEIYQELEVSKVKAPLPIIKTCLDKFSEADSRILNRLHFATTAAERFEVVHDRLAEQIYAKFSAGELRRREAIATIQNKLRRFQEATTEQAKKEEYLSIGEIELARETLNIQALPKNLSEFWIASVAYYQKRQRRNRWILIGVSGAAAIFLLVALVAIFFYLESERNLRTAQVKGLLNEARFELKSTKNNLNALHLVEEALSIDSADFDAKKFFYELCYRDLEQSPFLLYHTPLDLSVNIHQSQFLPSGNGFMTRTDTLVQIWDTDGILQKTFNYNNQQTTVADISADERFLAVVYENKSLLVWDIEQETVHEIVDFEESGTHLSYGPFTNFIGIIFSDKAFELYDQEWNSILRLNNIQKNYFSPDGKHLIVVVRAEKEQENTFDALQIYNTEGQLKATITNQANVFINFDRVGISFSKDGSKFTTASLVGAAEVWNMEGQLELTLRGHEGFVTNSLTFSPSGNYLLTASPDGTAKVWDTSGNEISILEHENRVSNALFSNTDNTITTTSFEEKSTKIWDRNSNLKSVLIPPKGWIPIRSNFSKDNQKLLMTIESLDNTGLRSVLLWDNRSFYTALQHFAPVQAAAIHPNTSTLVTVAIDGSGKIWNNEGTSVGNFRLPSGDVEICRFSLDGDFLLTAGGGGEITAWNFRDIDSLNQTQKILTEHENRITSINWLEQSKHFISTAEDGKLLVWKFDISQSSFIVEEEFVEQEDTWIEQLAISSNQPKLAAASSDGQIKIWDFRHNNPEKKLHLSLEKQLHTDRVNSICFSGKGNHVLSASEDGLVQLWSLNDNEVITLRANENTTPVNTAVFSPNSKYILSVDETEGWRLILWNLEGKILDKAYGHENEITAIQFLNNTDYFLTADMDGVIFLWHLNHLTETMEFVVELKAHQDLVFSTLISPDLNYFLSVSEDGKAIIWPLSYYFLKKKRNAYDIKNTYN